jgi:formiminotetrahydrofolate cyclodeaminase
VAGTTVAAAAGLVAMAARFSGTMDGAETVVGAADELRVEAGELADRDARSYAAVLAAYRAPRDDEAARRGDITAALTVATAVPLAIVGCAQRVGMLGVRVAVDGNPNLRGDAVTAVNLADAAARSATHLVALNIRSGQLDRGPLDRARSWCDDLRRAVATLEEEPA